MSKFVIEPNNVYDLNFCSFRFFIRVIECCYSYDSLEAVEVEEYEEA